MTKKMIKIIVDIFGQTFSQEDKREFIVQGMISLLSSAPNIPMDLFILGYPQNHIVGSSDFVFISEAISYLNDEKAIVKVGEFLKELLFFDVLGNHSLLGILEEIVRKIADS